MLAILSSLAVLRYQCLQVTGLKIASAKVGSWIIATVAVFVAILGWLVLKERLEKLQLIEISLATLGALAVVGRGNPMDLFSRKAGTFGDFFFLLSSVNWAIFTILS